MRLRSCWSRSEFFLVFPSNVAGGLVARSSTTKGIKVREICWILHSFDISETNGGLRVGSFGT